MIGISPFARRARRNQTIGGIPGIQGKAKKEEEKGLEPEALPE
jgi:hypothetical protein